MNQHPPLHESVNQIQHDAAAVPSALHTNPSGLLIYLRQNEALNDVQELKRIHTKCRFQMASRKRQGTSLTALLAQEKHLRKAIQGIEERHILDGPMCEVTSNRFHECGALTHLVVVGSLMCISKADLMPACLEHVEKHIRSEECFQAFSLFIKPESVRKRAEDFLWCLDAADVGMKSTNPGKRERYEALLREVIVELKSEDLKPGPCRQILHGYEAENVILPSLQNAFLNSANNFQIQGRASNDKRRDAVLNLNTVLFKILEAGPTRKI